MNLYGKTHHSVKFRQKMLCGTNVCTNVLRLIHSRPPCPDFIMGDNKTCVARRKSSREGELDGNGEGELEDLTEDDGAVAEGW